MAEKITEAQLERTVKDLAERMGWLYYHTHRSQHSPAGFPDCVMLRGDRQVVAELKVGENQPSESPPSSYKEVPLSHARKSFLARCTRHLASSSGTPWILPISR